MRNGCALLFLTCAAAAFAQLEEPVATVPRLVRVSNTFHPANGLPAAPVESVTFSIYNNEHDGAPLWQETQNVSVDAEGHYNAVLGATLTAGLPVDLFRGGEQRWLGVMFNRPGETEQPRVQLVSVPYALKASDAETLGGRPASAYLLDPNAAATGGATSTTTAAASSNPQSMKPRTISGTMNYIPYFTDSTNDLGNSVLYQSRSNVGIGTTSPATSLHIFDTVNNGGNTGNLLVESTTNNAGLRLMNDQTGGRDWIVASSGGNASAPSSFRIIDLTANTDRLDINSAGNVGIGVISPATLLHIFDPVNNGGITGNVLIESSTKNAGLRLRDDQTGGRDWILASSGGNASTPNSFRIIDLTANTDRLDINSAGQVGVGTTTPGYPLDVAGDINFSGILRYKGVPVQEFSLQDIGNTSSGVSALASLTSGTNNTAIGALALNLNDAGASNTGVGYFALKNNTGGDQNTALGAQALESTTGGGNTAVGFGALENVQGGSSNIAIGLSAGSSVVTGSDNIEIGNSGSSSDSDTIRIGGSQTSFYAAGVGNVNLASDSNALPVMVDTTTGQLGTNGSSSRRFKEDIQDMGDATNGLMRLRPVTFRYKQPAKDGSKPLQYGLIAEEVAQVYPDLVVYSADGQVEGVKYQLLDSMLLNEVQKQQNEISSLKDRNRDLEERLSRLEAAMEKMTSGVRTTLASESNHSTQR